MSNWIDQLQDCDQPPSVEEVSVGDRVHLYYLSGFGYLVLMSVDKINVEEKKLFLSYVGLFDWHNKFPIESLQILPEVRELRGVEIQLRKIHKIVKMPEDMAVRMASDLAIKYIHSNFGDHIRDVYLEGIDWIESNRSWKITIGFSREETIEPPINTVMANISGAMGRSKRGWIRRYKQVEVSSLTGEATSVTFDPEDHD